MAYSVSALISARIDISLSSSSDISRLMRISAFSFIKSS